MLSNCCNAEIIECPHCVVGKCSNCGAHAYSTTPPTSTEVEERVERELVTFGQIMQRTSPESVDKVRSTYRYATQSIIRLIKQARIDEWKILGDYLTEADKKVVSRTFLDLYRIHGEGLQGKLAQLKEATNETK